LKDVDHTNGAKRCQYPAHLPCDWRHGPLPDQGACTTTPIP